MRNIVNLIITFMAFWTGNEYFHEYISIQDIKTMVLATMFMFVIGYLFRLLFVVSVFLIAVGVGCITTTIMFFLSFVLTPVKLWLLSTYLHGFEIHGFWTYVVLTVVLSIFSIKAKTKENSKESIKED